MIDAHHHLWWIGRHRYAWPPEVGDRLARDFTPDDLRPELARCGVAAGGIASAPRAGLRGLLSRCPGEKPRPEGFWRPWRSTKIAAHVAPDGSPQS
jgi:hypothetical protein